MRSSARAASSGPAAIACRIRELAASCARDAASRARRAATSSLNASSSARDSSTCAGIRAAPNHVPRRFPQRADHGLGRSRQRATCGELTQDIIADICVAFHTKRYCAATLSSRVLHGGPGLKFRYSARSACALHGSGHNLPRRPLDRIGSGQDGGTEGTDSDSEWALRSESSHAHHAKFLYSPIIHVRAS